MFLCCFLWVNRGVWMSMLTWTCEVCWRLILGVIMVEVCAYGERNGWWTMYGCSGRIWRRKKGGLWGSCLFCMVFHGVWGRWCITHSCCKWRSMVVRQKLFDSGGSLCAVLLFWYNLINKIIIIVRMYCMSSNHAYGSTFWFALWSFHVFHYFEQLFLQKLKISFGVVCVAYEGEWYK